jgi:hypothetical protein
MAVASQYASGQRPGVTLVLDGQDAVDEDVIEALRVLGGNSRIGEVTNVSKKIAGQYLTRQRQSYTV